MAKVCYLTDVWLLRGRNSKREIKTEDDKQIKAERILRLKDQECLAHLNLCQECLAHLNLWEWFATSRIYGSTNFKKLTWDKTGDSKQIKAGKILALKDQQCFATLNFWKMFAISKIFGSPRLPWDTNCKGQIN